MASHATTLSADRKVDVFRGVGGEVRQAAVLQVAPEELHGVQIRGVWRKPDDATARMSDEAGSHELVLVGASPIPEQDEWPADLTSEMAKKSQQFGAPNVAVRMQRQRQSDLPAPWRHDQRANARDLLVRARPHGNRRGGAAGRPRPAKDRHHQEADFIEADEMRAEPVEFFLPWPNPLDPLPHTTVVALLRARLWALRTEPTGAEQAPDVVGVVDDSEMVTDQVDDAPTRPQARPIASRFGPRDHQARQSLPLRGGELRRSTGCRPGAQARTALASVRPLPSADRAPIDAQALGDDMDGDVTLEQVDRAESTLLEFRRAPLWAHAAPPTGKYSRLGHYLGRYHQLASERPG